MTDKTYIDGLNEAAMIADSAAADEMAISQKYRESADPVDVEYGVAFHRRSMAVKKVADEIRVQIARQTTKGVSVERAKYRAEVYPIPNVN